MSGLEALGVACMMMQVITFARDTASTCLAVYQGQQTPDAAFEHNAVAMRDWATKLSAGHGSFSPEEKDLEQLVTQCSTTAGALVKEMQKITKYHKKSDLINAVRASLGSVRHRRKIEDLDRSLSGYMNTLQTIMTQQSHYRTKAIEVKQREGFAQMELNLQNFVSQLAAGHTEIKDLISKEHASTQQHNTREIEAAKNSIEAHVDNAASQQRASEAASKRYERLIGSLKSPSMRQRENAIMEPADAHFSRVFRAFDKEALRVLAQGDTDNDDVATSYDSESYDSEIFEEEISEYNESLDESSIASWECSDVDSVWQSFLKWLQSETKVYWVSGIPGSGKSTLIKFIVQQEQTERLLRLWRSTVKILSHFFWKIGSSSQHSLKGLLTSLLYQLLEDNETLAEGLINALKLARLKAKEFYDDWSISELEKALSIAIDLHPSSLCIFIDGLDEFVDMDGPKPLLETIQRLAGHVKIKLCVASRPEPRLREKLQQFPSLRLQDLTRPEMRKFVKKRFSGIEIPKPLREELSNVLLDKAQGSFLWIRLASKSLLDGIDNGDSESFLQERLRNLPPELDELYAGMWKRLNRDEPIYRQMAARHFMFVISAKKLEIKTDPLIGPASTKLVLLDMMYAHEAAQGRCPLQTSCPTETALLKQAANDPPHVDARAKCRSLEREILVQCAGLLTVSHNQKPSRFYTGPVDTADQVEFIHRTAYDFLVDTEAGQKILSNANLTSNQACVQVLKGYLASLHFWGSAWNFKRGGRKMSEIVTMLQSLANNPETSEKDIDLIFQSTQRLYEKIHPSFQTPILPNPPFLSVLLQERQWDDLTARFIEKLSPAMATDVLRASWHPRFKLRMRISALSTFRLLWAGADPNLPAVSAWRGTLTSTRGTPIPGMAWLGRQEPRFAERGTALWNCLVSVNTFVSPPMSQYAEVIAFMAEKCQDLDERALVSPPPPRGDTGPSPLFSDGSIWSSFIVWRSPDVLDNPLVIVEVNLQFLIEHSLRIYNPDFDKSDDGHKSIVEARKTNPFARVRFVMGPGNLTDGKVWQVQEHHPIQDLFWMLCDLDGTYALAEPTLYLTWKRHLERMVASQDPGVIERDYESVVQELCEAGLGLCSWKDSGLALPESSEDPSNILYGFH